MGESIMTVYLEDANEGAESLFDKKVSKNEMIFETIIFTVLIAVAIHGILVITIMDSIYEVFQKLNGGAWWYQGIGAIGYLALLALSGWLAINFWKSTFSKRSRIICVVVLAGFSLLNFIGDFTSRNTRLEDQYLCWDDISIGPYAHDKPFGKYKKSFKCISIKDGDLYDSAKAISEGAKPQIVSETDPVKLSRLMLNENGAQKIFASTNKRNGLFVLYYGAGVGNYPAGKVPDYLIPATQEMLDFNVTVHTKATQSTQEKKAPAVVSSSQNSATKQTVANSLPEPDPRVAALNAERAKNMAIANGSMTQEVERDVPTHLKIEFLERKPPKENFYFSSGSKIEGNKVSEGGPIRIVSQGCVPFYISVDDGPQKKICDENEWRVTPGQVWKIRGESGEIKSQNIRVELFK
jgi:hypothetical protein